LRWAPTRPITVSSMLASSTASTLRSVVNSGHQIFHAASRFS
jgi:hypothetical protein